MPIFFDTAIGAPAGYAGAGLVGSMINPLTPLDPQWLDNDNRGSKRASNGTRGTKLPKEDEWKPEGPLKQTQQYLDFYNSLDNARQMLDYKTTNALNEAYDRGDIDSVRRIEGEYQQGISKISSMKNQRQITEHSLKVEAGNRQQAYTELKPVMDNPALLQDASSLLDNPERFIENLVSIDNSNVRYNPNDNELYRADSDSKNITIDDGLLMLKPGAKNKLTGRNYFDFSTNYEALGYFDRNQEVPLLPDGTINPVAAQFKTPHKSVISGKEHFENVRGALKDAGNLSMESNPIIVNIASGSNLDMGALQEAINNTRTYYAANSNTATFKTDIPNINAVIAGTWGILSPEAKNYVFTQYAKENRENIVGATDAALNAEIAETKYSKALEMKTNGDTTITDKKLQELKADAQVKKAESVKIGKLITDDVKNFAFLQTLGISQGMESLAYMQDINKSGKGDDSKPKSNNKAAGMLLDSRDATQSFTYLTPQGDYKQSVFATKSFTHDRSQSIALVGGDKNYQKMNETTDPTTKEKVPSNLKLNELKPAYLLSGGVAVRPEKFFTTQDNKSLTESGDLEVYVTNIASKGIYAPSYDPYDYNDGRDDDGVYGNLKYITSDETAEVYGKKISYKGGGFEGTDLVPMYDNYAGYEIVVAPKNGDSKVDLKNVYINVPKPGGKGYDKENLDSIIDNKEKRSDMNIVKQADGTVKMTVYARIDGLYLQEGTDNKLYVGAAQEENARFVMSQYAERGRQAFEKKKAEYMETLKGKIVDGNIQNMGGRTIVFKKDELINNNYNNLINAGIVKDINVSSGTFGISEKDENMIEYNSNTNINAINQIKDETIKNKLLVYELWKKETKLNNIEQLIDEKKIMYFIESSSLDELKQAINYKTKNKFLPYQLILEKNKATGGSGKEF